jgi:hypothetical protein
VRDDGLQRRDTLRRAVRYHVCAPVEYWWLSAEGIVHSGSGISRDISPLGVFVKTPLPLDVGLSIQMDIRLPRLEGRESGLRLHAEGDVVRSEKGDTDCGFAVSAAMYPGTESDLSALSAGKTRAGRPESISQDK